MTILIYRDGILAADTATWKGDVTNGFVQKLFRTRDDELIYGLSGNYACTSRFRAWIDGARSQELGVYAAREPFEPKGGDAGFAAMLIDRAGAVFWMDDAGSIIRCDKEPFYVIGYETAQAIAYGALESGATAAQTVEICIKRCSHVGGSVQTLRIKGADHGQDANEEAVRKVEL